MSERSEPIRVLHVDDEPGFAEVAGEFLEREDDRITVETATGAREGLQRLANREIDCVVSDYDMPGRNGIEFLEAVREKDDRLPFVLFTGKGSEEIASEAISAGVTDYLQKDGTSDQYAVLANRVTNAVERFRAERDAERTRSRLETLISNVPGVVYRCRNEPGWPMEQVEGECERLTGYSAADLESGAVVWGEDVLHPEDRESMWETVQEALAAGEYFEVTYRIVTADGTTKWMWERGRAVTSAGEVTTLEGFITDITERERRKRELERERDRLAAVFDAVPHPITEVEFRDGQPVVQQVNDAFEEVFGYAEETVVGESLDEFIVPEEYHEEAASLNHAATERLSIERELERETADGERRTFLFRSSRVRREDETHWLGTYVDLS